MMLEEEDIHSNLCAHNHHPKIYILKKSTSLLLGILISKCKLWPSFFSKNQKSV